MSTEASPALPARVEHALSSLRALNGLALRHPMLLPEVRDETGERFLARFERLLEGLIRGSTDYEFDGREVITTVQLHYPELWAALDRRLLWFFGGDCLHFLDDEEIDAFQREEDGC